MDEKPVTADVVVACVAGIGASAGVFVQDAGDAPTYASELFGSGSEVLAIQYPTCQDAESGAAHPKATCDTDGTDGVSDDEGKSTSVRSRPWVRLYWSTNSTISDVAFDSRPGVPEPSGEVATGDKVEITFKLSFGEFAETVGSTAFTASALPDGSTISIERGGAVGDDSVTFALTAGGALTDDSTYTFVLPRLRGLSALGAGHVNAASMSVTTRSTQGDGFPTGTVGAYYCPMAAEGDTPASDACNETMGDSTARAKVVVKDGQAVLFSHFDTNPMDGVQAAPANTGDNAVRINIDDRTMLRANAWSGPYSAGVGNPYRPNTHHVTDGDGQVPAARLLDITLTVRSKVGDTPLLQWDGSKVDSDVAGVLDVDVTGDRGLFAEDDRVFVNFGPSSDTGHWATGYGGAATIRTIDSGEALTVDGNMASFTVGGLSIDPGDVDEDDPDGMDTRRIAVFYIPGGKSELEHGTMLKTVAVVNYTRATTADEGAVRGSVELRLHGVDNELKAYAVPFDGNGKGDKANVRIRCESGDTFSGGKECRAFLECWDDMGMRSFGEVMPAIMENSLMTLDAMEIEDVLGMEDAAMSRHSCRVLATGLPSVQTLVRDGTSGTLINNSFVEDM